MKTTVIAFLGVLAMASIILNVALIVRIRNAPDSEDMRAIDCSWFRMSLPAGEEQFALFWELPDGSRVQASSDMSNGKAVAQSGKLLITGIRSDSFSLAFSVENREPQPGSLYGGGTVRNIARSEFREGCSFGQEIKDSSKLSPGAVLFSWSTGGGGEGARRQIKLIFDRRR